MRQLPPPPPLENTASFILLCIFFSHQHDFGEKNSEKRDQIEEKTLTSFSKLLEKIMYKRLYNFLKCYNILNAEQFGFRPGHATSHATTLVISNIADAFEKKLLTIGVFLDLSKVLTL